MFSSWKAAYIAQKFWSNLKIHSWVVEFDLRNVRWPSSFIIRVSGGSKDADPAVDHETGHFSSLTNNRFPHARKCQIMKQDAKTGYPASRSNCRSTQSIRVQKVRFRWSHFSWVCSRIWINEFTQVSLKSTTLIEYLCGRCIANVVISMILGVLVLQQNNSTWMFSTEILLRGFKIFPRWNPW